MKAAEKSARAKQRADAPTRAAIVFAARCSLLRRALRMTQAQFAARLGRHWLTVSRWERMAGYLPSTASLQRFEAMEKEYEQNTSDRGCAHRGTAEMDRQQT